MSQEHKKSFVLYFDAYPCIAALPVEQRGELLLQLFRYAMAEDKAPTDPETILEQYPVLNGEGRMAYSFLAETIRRDTEKWKDKQRRYQAAAARRWEEHASSPPSGAGKSGRMPQSDPNDVAWMKPYIDQRDKS